MSDVETIERQAREIRARDAEIERLRSALHDAEAIGDFPSELRDRLSLKENAAAFEKMANEAIAIGQTFLAQRDERDAEIADMKSWVERRDEEIARWKAAHEQSEWRGAAYLELLREAHGVLADIQNERNAESIEGDCEIRFPILAKIESVLSSGGAASKDGA